MNKNKQEEALYCTHFVQTLPYGPCVAYQFWVTSLSHGHNQSFIVIG